MASYEVPLNMLLGEGDNSFPLKKRGGVLTSQCTASHLFALPNGLHRPETDIRYKIYSCTVVANFNICGEDNIFITRISSCNEGRLEA